MIISFSLKFSFVVFAYQSQKQHIQDDNHWLNTTHITSILKNNNFRSLKQIKLWFINEHFCLQNKTSIRTVNKRKLHHEIPQGEKKKKKINPKYKSTSYIVSIVNIASSVVPKIIPPFRLPYHPTRFFFALVFGFFGSSFFRVLFLIPGTFQKFPFIATLRKK